MDAPYRIRSAVPADAAGAGRDRAARRSAIRGARPASARRSTSPWTFGLVAEAGAGVAGYLIGREVAGTGEVLNLAVAPEFRRRGIGGALLEAGLAALRRRRVEEVFLEVRESNRSAQALYSRYGFRPVGQRAAYYRNPKEDALVLRLELAQRA